MWKWIFEKPCLDEVRRNELYEAQAELLIAQTKLEANQSNVDYNKKRIMRLTAELKKADVGVTVQPFDDIHKR